MRSFIYLTSSLLLVTTLGKEQPSSCLLQHGSSPLQRTALVQEGVRQEPSGHGESAPDDKQGGLEKQGGHAEDGHHQDGKEGGHHQDGEEHKHSDSKGEHGKDESGGSNQTQEEIPPMQDAPLASLRLELRLPIAIKDLKESKGPLPDFLEKLRRVFAEAANIPTDRVDVLGVRGAYSDEGVSLHQVFEQEVKASLEDGLVLAEDIGGEHSVVDLEVLPSAHATDMSPKSVYMEWKDQLSHKDSPLKKGQLKDYLLGAKLEMRQGVQGLLPHEVIEPSGANLPRLSFLGILAILLSYLVL